MGDVVQQAPAVAERDGFSRRRFIQGVIATGASVSASSYVFRDGTVVRAPGAVERLVTVWVNGQQRRVDVVPHETLATTLRYKLGLTGTKIGCDRAECGACTVLVDRVPHYACSLLTHQVRGRAVVTVEGLEAADGTLHPVQQAVVEEQGFQCAVLYAGVCDEHGGDGGGAAPADAGGGGTVSVRGTCAGVRTTTRS